MTAKSKREASPSRILPAAGLILVAAILLGTASNLLSPRRIPWVGAWDSYIETKAFKAGITLVDARQAHNLFQAGRHLFFDARPVTDYRARHIPTAFSVPYENLSEAIVEVQMFLSPEQPIVTYCSGEQCDESFLLTIYLRDQGFTHVILFAGGMAEWEEAGYETEERP